MPWCLPDGEAAKHLDPPPRRAPRGSQGLQSWDAALHARQDGQRQGFQCGHALQSGHRGSAVERELLLDLPVFVALAMIGPRRFSRGKRQRASEYRIAFWLQWGHGVSAVESAGGKATAISKVFQEGFERGLGLANDLRRGHRHARARVQGWRNLPKSLVRVGPGISRSPDRSNQS